MSWTGRRKKGQIWRFTLETGNPPRLCVKARPTIRHGRACTRDSKIVPPYVPQDVQSTLSSDRDDRRQVPSGAKITAPDCAEDQPPAAAYRCGCGRGRQRHVRGVHKNGSPGTLKPSSSQTPCRLHRKGKHAASRETGARNQNQQSMGDVVRPAPSRLISSAGGVLSWEGQVTGITQLH